MFKLLSILTYFIRELVFDSKDEYDFSSPKFNSRKFIVFLAIIFSVLLNLFTITKVFNLAKDKIHSDTVIKMLKYDVVNLQDMIDKKVTSETSCKIELKSCVKNNRSTSSNEDNPSIRKNIQKVIYAR